jgi:flagellum-specific peptidoglycan hydrolase FlgJ
MSTKIENYVVSNFQYAKAAGLKFNMDPMVILAQGAHESGWGTSGLATRSNNFFGITAGGTKNEYWDGTFYQAQNKYKLKFRVYKTPQDSFYDFARLISSKYKSAHAAGQDYKTYAQRIAYSPYISEANGDNREGYRTGIINLYERIIDIVKKKALT